MGEDILRKAELKAQEIFNEHYDVKDLMRRKTFVTELGNIADKLEIDVYIIDFENSFKEDPKFSKLAEFFKEQRVEGFTLKDSNQIYIDNKTEPARQRFTAAHELGHIVLGHFEGEGMSVAFRNSTSSPRLANEMELSANSFAAELLMPEALMLEAVKYTKSTTELASIFGVTINAMNRRMARLEELGAIK